ncbi:Rieske (2Fe-2S) protein [Maricurvus nonylphenolicus]|uniref:Rieske (2Fe-2S) protein n=1 Tax=Maricurvus nonylphenolicus TaxID=1008307 RepID=UPI0036F3FA42
MKKLCHIDEIDNHNSKGFDFHGQLLFAVRQQDNVYVYRNSCPHLGIQLEWLPDRFLDVEGELIQCSTHGALFTIDEGLCISGPCSGQSLQAVDHEVRDQEIYVALD